MPVVLWWAYALVCYSDECSKRRRILYYCTHINPDCQSKKEEEVCHKFLADPKDFLKSLGSYYYPYSLSLTTSAGQPTQLPRPAGGQL
jgi:hypothetical protein